jgi:hypothetical protein
VGRLCDLLDTGNTDSVATGSSYAAAAL